MLLVVRQAELTVIVQEEHLLGPEVEDEPPLGLDGGLEGGGMGGPECLLYGELPGWQVAAEGAAVGLQPGVDLLLEAHDVGVCC